MAFVVKAEPLQVRVLGTAFNVVNHQDRMSVTLVEGKVEVQAAGNSINELKPNEHYSWQAASQQGAIETLSETQYYTSWREEVWTFDETSLREIAQQLEYDYGKTVNIANNQLAEMKLSGSAPAKNLESLVKGISMSLGITVQIKPNQITFTP